MVVGLGRKIGSITGHSEKSPRRKVRYRKWQLNLATVLLKSPCPFRRAIRRGDLQNRLLGVLVVRQSGKAVYKTANLVFWFLAP